jgi:hypothetical protein
MTLRCSATTWECLPRQSGDSPLPGVLNLAGHRALSPLSASRAQARLTWSIAVVTWGCQQILGPALTRERSISSLPPDGARAAGAAGLLCQGTHSARSA